LVMVLLSFSGSVATRDGSVELCRVKCRSSLTRPETVLKRSLKTSERRFVAPCSR
jgi:hypothetical protein